MFLNSKFSICVFSKCWTNIIRLYWLQSSSIF